MTWLRSLQPDGCKIAFGKGIPPKKKFNRIKKFHEKITKKQFTLKDWFEINICVNTKTIWEAQYLLKMMQSI